MDVPSSSSMMQRGADLLVDYVEKLWGNQIDKVVKLRAPNEIKKNFSAAGCSLEISGASHSDDEMLQSIATTMDNSVHSNHRLFFNQLYGRTEPAGLLAQWMVSTIASSSYTYEVAPVFVLMEGEVLRKMASVAGMPEDTDGLFVPGGSISNLYSLHLARFKAFPQVKEEGIAGCPPLVAFCSAHAHYSFKKAAHVLGLGARNLVEVPCNVAGQMDIEELRKAIQAAVDAGKKPFYVAATAGTTVTGAFDDIQRIREIANEFGMWMHVDGAWGGCALLSQSEDVRRLIAGVQDADSFTWNPHKFMGVPLQCAVFLTKYNGLLKECNATGASYLFQTDKNHAEHDIGDKTIQCGRLPDAAKVWFAWQSVGDQGWADRVQHAMDLSQGMVRAMHEDRWRGSFKLVIDPSFINLCFWYIPPGMEGIDPHNVLRGSPEWAQLHSVASRVKDQMQREGLAMIGFQSIQLDRHEVPNFFRMVFSSTWNVTVEDLVQTLDDIDRIGSQLK